MAGNGGGGGGGVTSPGGRTTGARGPHPAARIMTRAATCQVAAARRVPAREADGMRGTLPRARRAIQTPRRSRHRAIAERRRAVAACFGARARATCSRLPYSGASGPITRSVRSTPRDGRPRARPSKEKRPMRSRYMVGTAVALLVAFALAGCGGGAGSGKDELVIGEYGSMTGGDADFGQSTKRGVDMALDDLTAQKQGKIGGLPVRVVAEDDQGKPEEAATAVQKLINQDRVIAVIGEVASSRSLAGGPICQTAGVPMISPSSTNPKVTEVGNFIFRMCFIH